MKPIAKYLVIKQINEEVKAKSGFIVSGKDANETRYVKGKVISVGDEVDKVKKDDIILYDKNGSFTMVIEDDTVTIIQLREVVGVF